MKQIILIFLLTLISCKKERLDREIEIIGYNYESTLNYTIANGHTLILPKNTRYTIMVKGDETCYGSVASIKKGSAVKGTKDTLNEGFRLVLISNKKCVYDKIGSHHTFKF